MKINNVGLPRQNPYNQNNNNINRSQKSAVKQSDKIEISTAAKEMQQISQFTAERNERVAGIKAQVENGTYKIDPEKVANGIYNYYFRN